MSVSNPEEMHAAFVNSFNAWDADAVTALYEPEAVLIHGPGVKACGLAAIRAVYLHMFSMRPKMELTTQTILRSGDIALTTANWKVRGVALDGSPIKMEGRSTEVLRRQSDGSWLFVVDNPLT